MKTKSGTGEGLPMKKVDHENPLVTAQQCTIQDMENGDALSARNSSSSLSRASSQATKREEHANQNLDSPHKETITFDDGPIPDGGYSWVIIVCQFISQMATWGMISPYGVFTSWFTSQGTYPGATSIQFGWIAGTFGAVVFSMSPLSNYISKLLPLRFTLAIAQTILALGLILSGFTTQIWQLTLTQGLMCGLGIGLNFMATQPLISQWFLKRRALAMGISSGGVGAGGLVFSFTTRLALANHGVRFAYIMNGVIVFAMLTPTTLLLKSRMHVSHPKFRTFRWKLLKNWGLVFICIWAFFLTYGYLVPLFSVTSYATQGLGLSQAQGASVQAIFAAGQLIGRPALGLILDRFGRVNMASLVTLLSGVACLCIWMFAQTYGVLLFFGLSSGILSGIFYSALAPVLSEVVPLSDFSDALSIIWIVCAPITLVCTPIAFTLDEYSKSGLGRTGTDVFKIAIGTAGGTSIAAAIALFVVKRFQRKEQDV